MSPLHDATAEGLLPLEEIQHTPPESQHHAKVFNIDYTVLDWPQWGKLFLTHHGMARRDFLHPSQWFVNRRFYTVGHRLDGGTGMVYQVPTVGPGNRQLELVVKFSRFAQDVPLYVSTTLPPDVKWPLPENLQFNSPFEEFANLEDLRRGTFGPKDLRIMTKRPLAIFKTHEKFPVWQLGRSKSMFRRYQHQQHDDQMTVEESEVEEIEIDCIYITIFEWVSGMDAETCVVKGLLTEEEMVALWKRVVNELNAKGYHVLDHKSRHIILRPQENGKLLTRNGQLVYALVDFELLLRTDEYEAWRQEQKNLVRKDWLGKTDNVDDVHMVEGED